MANYDATDRSYKKSMKILGWNDIELNAMGKKRFKYEVTEDECKVSYRLNKSRNSESWPIMFDVY